MRIAHISDVHIRNHKYHDEYLDIFEKLYDSLKNNDIDMIINTGDLVHQKLSLSPSVFKLSLEMTKNLSDIAPLHMIIGNHDMNLRSKGKMDILSSVVDSINSVSQNKNICLYKHSGYHNIDNNIDLGIYSLLDNEEEWPLYTNKKNISIALYHGIAEGTVADGFTFSNATPIKNFEEYDYCMLGHVHSKQKVSDKPLTWYCGSLIQQNFGEGIEKGYLIWDIKSKTDCKIEHINLNNPSPFVTLNFNEGIKKEDIQQDSKLRIRYDSSIDKRELNSLVHSLRKDGKCQKIVLLKERELLNESKIKGIEHDQKTQNEYIKDYLTNVLKIKDDDIIGKVMELNLELDKKFNTATRSGKWSIEYLKWDNTFNYGAKNVLNFGDFNDIVGIFGKNFSGKTSVVDTLFASNFWQDIKRRCQDERNY